MSKKHIIWSNLNLNYDDWKADLEEEYPDLTDDERLGLMYETNDYYLDDERVNLNIALSQPIIIIADLGLWNGRFSGYKEIRSGNIRDCLYADADYCEWYVDERGDLCATAVHHDGTNHYTYRVYKDSASDIQRINLKSKIYSGSVTRADITRVTSRLGDYIANVYGWNIQKPHNKRGPLQGQN